MYPSLDPVERDAENVRHYVMQRVVLRHLVPYDFIRMDCFNLEEATEISRRLSAPYRRRTVFTVMFR